MHQNNMELGTPWYDQAPVLLLTAAKTTPRHTDAPHRHISKTGVEYYESTLVSADSMRYSR